MIFLLWVKGIFKSLGWKGIAILAVIGLIVFLWRGNQSLKAKVKTLRLEMITAEAKIDTVFVDAEYSPPDTVWRTIIRTFTDTLTGKVDTLYEDIPVISGDISFDTTKVFGGDFNPLSVTVSGRFYYPTEFSHRNWLLIVPEWGKPPVTPVARRTPRKQGVGLGLLVSSNGAYSVGGIGRFNRTSVDIYRQIDQNVWTLGLGYEILRF